jgi:predicted nucleic acid-binding protein
VKLLLDTTVLVDVLRRRRQRREFVADLARAGHIICTTLLNVAEIYAGIRAGEESDAEALLISLQLYELTGMSARLAGTLRNIWSRKGHTLSLADAIVAAIAIENECQLLTDNQKHFPMGEIRLYPLP